MYINYCFVLLKYYVFVLKRTHNNNKNKFLLSLYFDIYAEFN